MSASDERVTAVVAVLHEQRGVPVLADLYDLTSPAVYAWALDHAPPPLAEQIVVETYTDLWTGAGTYRPGVSGWCWVTAHALVVLRRHHPPTGKDDPVP
ncbi:RNA polymerase sigma factor [Auraticoccus monumenti]|uniref:hypothetical protein n=1 Tax=Auraticoccus monumenti TaxID=675864 RepID=UPI000B874573|nr:hypothetical protein [Auraticoccus monumenti]